MSDQNGQESSEESHAFATRLRELLERQGTPARQQAALVAELCHLSVSQARRKLQGGSWLFSEVVTVAQYCGVPLNDLAHGQAGDEPALAVQPAMVLLEGGELAGDVALGHLLSPRDQQRYPLQALRDGHRWIVGAPGPLRRFKPDAPRYAVERVRITPPRTRPELRIAVVDDDPLAAEALCDWFNESGAQSSAYGSAAALLAAGDFARIDAFVVDFILGGGQSSEALIAHLRHQRPHAPIALLTGRLRDGTASEESLTALLRSLNVMFFEKPVRPGVLLAALLGGLERTAGTPHG